MLIKNAEALERMEKIDTLVIDKTGTLTEGKPKVVAVVSLPGFDEAQVLRLAASVERGSEHPLAAAIVKAAAERKIELGDVQGFDSPAGKGVIGMVEGLQLALGNAKFLAELNIDTSSSNDEAEKFRSDGATAIFFGINGKLAGVIAIADPVKTTTPEALKALTALNIRVVMLTGDNRTTALAVAKTLGITEVEAEVLPDQKSAVIEKLTREGRVVAMAGDGVNDAPALAAAAGRHRHGHRLGCGDRERRHHAAQGRPHRHRQGARAVESGHEQYPAEFVFRLHLQRRRRADRGRRALSRLRAAAVAGHRRRRHGAVVGQRHRERVAAAPRGVVGVAGAGAAAGALQFLAAAEACKSLISPRTERYSGS